MQAERLSAMALKKDATVRPATINKIAEEGITRPPAKCAICDFPKKGKNQRLFCMCGQ